MKTVIIVESPAKARKIQGFFTDGTKCIASMGHIYDLDPTSLSIDVERGFQPKYHPCQGKSKIIRTLRELSKDHRLILGADDDREGDAIAWHCGRVAKMDFKQKNRIIFHEISKSSIQNAMQNVHRLQMDSVNAQQARRIIDRLVGFLVSPLLWKHIQTETKGLSAGRVQTTLLSLLNEHETRIREFRGVPKVSCKGEFTFTPSSKTSLANGTFQRATKTPSESFEPSVVYGSFIENRAFRIRKQTTATVTENPPAPLITSTLQRVSARSLRFSLQKTMGIAQKLYENGKITYMRTDSPTMSPEFQGKLREYIHETYSRDSYQATRTSKTVKGAQEAHECIRVTDLMDSVNAPTFTKDDIALYECIRRHTVISHMKPALYTVLHMTLHTPESESHGSFQVSQRYLTYLGYLAYRTHQAYQKGETKSEVENVPVVPEDTIFHLQSAVTVYENTRPPLHLDESTIVKNLEASGIGRPSTYASLVQTLDKRAYTEKAMCPQEAYEIQTVTLDPHDDITRGTETKTPPGHTRVRVTPLGSQVLTYLLAHFPQLFHVGFTAGVEQDLDRIAGGTIEWVVVVRKVYDSFIGDVAVQKSQITQTSRGKVKELGCHKGIPVFLKHGRYGPYISYGSANKNLKNVLKTTGKTYDTLELSDVRELLRFPIHLGNHEGHPLLVCLGPHGTYLSHHNQNVRIPLQETYTMSECLRCLLK
jgi:DNA topoisomerase-1